MFDGDLDGSDVGVDVDSLTAVGGDVGGAVGGVVGNDEGDDEGGDVGGTDGVTVGEAVGVTVGVTDAVTDAVTDGEFVREVFEESVGVNEGATVRSCPPSRQVFGL